MTNDSMTISHCAIDRIHASTTASKIDEIKRTIYLLTNGCEWELMPSEGLFKYVERELETGIFIRWNELEGNSKKQLDGRLVCSVVGEYLKSLDLIEQLFLMLNLSKHYSISRLDIKFQLNNPEIPIAGLQKMVYLTGLDTYIEIDYKGFDEFHNNESGSKLNQHRSHSTLLKPAKHDKKKLSIYDPFEKHGIANAQHWELQLKSRYAQTVLKQLESSKNDINKINSLIVELVLGSVEFTWESKPMPWYRRLKKAPIVNSIS